CLPSDQLRHWVMALTSLAVRLWSLGVLSYRSTVDQRNRAADSAAKPPRGRLCVLPCTAAWVVGRSELYVQPSRHLLLLLGRYRLFDQLGALLHGTRHYTDSRDREPLWQCCD